MEESKKEVDQTTPPIDSTEEKKDSPTPAESPAQKPIEDEDDKVSLSKKELETLKSKAEDFDRSIKLQRIAKLEEKTKKVIPEKKLDEDEESYGQIDENAIIEKAIEAGRKAGQEAASETFLATRKEEFGKSLATAYDKWIADNNWASSDDTIKAIAENFNPPNSIKEEDIIAELDTAAIKTFPRAYKEALEHKAKSKILAESANIDAGDASGSSVMTDNTVAPNVTKEDQRMADRFFGGDIKRYLKHKKD